MIFKPSNLLVRSKKVAVLYSGKWKKVQAHNDVGVAAKLTEKKIHFKNIPNIFELLLYKHIRRVCL